MPFTKDYPANWSKGACACPSCKLDRAAAFITPYNNPAWDARSPEAHIRLWMDATKDYIRYALINTIIGRRLFYDPVR